MIVNFFFSLKRTLNRARRLVYYFYNIDRLIKKYSYEPEEKAVKFIRFVPQNLFEKFIHKILTLGDLKV